MLDKSIPYAEIWMKRTAEDKVIPVPDSNHYVIQPYQSGDESEWARIETAVGEFDTEAEARVYFEKEFLPYASQLPQRMFFAVNPAGTKVGTATAWWKKKDDGSMVSLVHWVAVVPSAQRQGIARGLVTKVLETFQKQTAPGAATTAIYLHTQTWSHAAINLYQQLGFELIATDYQGQINPEYEQVLAILKEVTQKESQ
jgi:ribosomal protein S18 acetylase RimI-like enzyme